MDNLPDKPNDLDKTANLLQRTLESFTAGVTGLAASDRRDLILSLGYILQRTRATGFLNSAMEEWEKYRKAGRIKDDRYDTQQHQECLTELLDALDRDSPDQLRFRMLKALFLGAATEEKCTRESPLPQQYMSLCRRLTAGEALILATTFSLVKCARYETARSSNAWLEQMAKASGLQYPLLVVLHERGLMEKNLISPRTLGDDSGVEIGTTGRLTPLALGLCEFISNFDEGFAKLSPK